MNRPVVAVLCLASLCCIRRFVHGAPVNSTDTVMVVSRVRPAPKIDGKLDDVAWVSASRIELRWTETGAIAPEYYRTQVSVVYDEKAVYIAFRNHDPDISDLRTDITEHDKCLVGDDAVGIFVEPDGTGKGHSFRVAVNAGNTVRDIWRPSEADLESRRQGKIPTELMPVAMAYMDAREWEPRDVESAIRIEDDFWTLEIRIPYKDLLECRPTGRSWGVNFVRRIVGQENLFVTWTNGGRKFMQPEQFGRLVFSD